MSKPPAFNPNYPQQGYSQPPPQRQAPPTQGYAPAPQGYVGGPGYAPPPGYGAPPPYGAPPQGHAPPPQGYAPPPQGYAPPPQGYAPPPQGYAPPPQGYVPSPQGYAPPQKGYAPPPQGQTVHVQTTVVKNQSTASSTLGGLVKSAGKLASGAVNTLQKEVDLYVSSPLLAKFGTDNILQFISCSSNRYLRVLSNGMLDSNGVPAGVDTQFVVVNHGHNIVSLRNLATQNKFVTITKGMLSCTGAGNFQCKFRIHETLKGFITFESLAEPGTHIGVLPTGEMKLPKLTLSKDASTQFSVNLLYTRCMAGQTVQQSHTVYHTK